MMNDNRILLVGAGHICEMMLEILATMDWQPAGIIDNNPTLHSVGDVPVLGSESHLRGLTESVGKAILTLDCHAGPRIRKFLHNSLKEMGYELPAIISPLATVAPDAIIGDGSLVFPYVTIMGNAVIGENCLIDANAVIMNDVSIGAHSVIGENVNIETGVKTGEGVRIGANSRIDSGVTLGKKCVIDDGSVIKADVPAYKIVRD